MDFDWINFDECSVENGLGAFHLSSPGVVRAPGADTHEIKDEGLVVLGVRPGAAPGYPSKISWLSSAMALMAIPARSAIKRPMPLRWLGLFPGTKRKV